MRRPHKLLKSNPFYCQNILSLQKGGQIRGTLWVRPPFWVLGSVLGTSFSILKFTGFILSENVLNLQNKYELIFLFFSKKKYEKSHFLPRMRYIYTYPNCHTCTPNLTAVHVHHFLYYKLCQAVDIFLPKVSSK